MKEIFHRDEKHENSVRQQINNTHAALQKLLDTWYNLEISGQPVRLQDLVLQPSKAYESAIRQHPDIPDSFGRLKVNKTAFVNVIDVPVPDMLYRQARDVRNMPFATNTDLWSLSDDGLKVERCEQTATELINERTIYITNKAQKQLAEKLTAYMEASNYLFDQIGSGIGYIHGSPFIVTAIGPQRVFNKLIFDNANMKQIFARFIE